MVVPMVCLALKGTALVSIETLARREKNRSLGSKMHQELTA